MSEFEVRIEFSGLCLFVRHENGDVSVLMPDARRRPSMDTLKHIDGTVGVPHAGYLKFDLADVPHAVSNGGGRRFEAVHRFSRETLELDLPRATAPVDVDELAFPDFRSIHDGLSLFPGLFNDPPPDQLLMRLRLSGGAFATHSGGSNWTFPDAGTQGNMYQGQFANFAVWTRNLKQPELTLRIRAFGEREGSSLTLRPRNGVLHLKIANLCAENPLEWDELKIRTIVGEEDLDFRWLYGLLNNVQSLVPNAGDLLPVPVLDRTSGAAGAEEDCTGGQIHE